MTIVKINNRPIIPFHDVKDAGLDTPSIPLSYRQQVEQKKKKIHLGQMKKPLTK